ncbi:type VII secretion-associated serine protease mycosin [Kitasatospora sp. NPDC006697]|uniref:type VII secretion-associated serine protease mycosin n=1 Tax=Kitasatospora sp. NPDC006697 TaxID=3364020 RepID=UPI003685B71F
MRRKLGRSAAIAAVLGLLAAGPAGVAAADAGGGTEWTPMGGSAVDNCKFPTANVPAEPWALQRVELDQLWAHATGAGVEVAVIDTGVDMLNPQLSGNVPPPGGNGQPVRKVDLGLSLLMDKSVNPPQPAKGDSSTDTVGHGTKVAGIIAASRLAGVGFVGLAPDAQILSIRQNDEAGDGDVLTLASAINQAVAHKVKVINISQDVRTTNGATDFPGSDQLKAALASAEQNNVVVVAATGNDGLEGPTFPASYDTVLSVGASDRNNERVSFSQYGDYVKVAAPGVDMLSTVPGGGQCVDNGTSFAAPYVAGVAALLWQEHPGWTAKQIRARIEQTAQRTERGPNKYIGWGVVDPVKAVTDTDPAADAAVADPAVRLDDVPIVPQPLGLGETQADRDRRTATYVLGGGALGVAALFGGSVVLRDLRRRRRA